MSVPTLTPSADAARLVQLAFESLAPPQLALASQALLAAHSRGDQYTGVVFDVGDGCSTASAFLDGRRVPDATFEEQLGGGDLTDLMLELLLARGHSFTTVAHREIARDVKERVCRVPLRPDEEAAQSREQPERATYELPDGEKLELRGECSLVGEALFEPELLRDRRWAQARTRRAHVGGIGRALWRALEAAGSRARREVLLVGGTSLMSGLRERLALELLSDSSLPLPSKCVFTSLHFTSLACTSLLSYSLTAVLCVFSESERPRRPPSAGSPRGPAARASPPPARTPRRACGSRAPTGRSSAPTRCFDARPSGSDR